MKLHTLTLGVMSLSAALVWSSAAPAAPATAVAKAKREIVRDAAKLTKFAYVTSAAHRDVRYVTGSMNRDGSFSLTYKFYYLDSDRDPQTYTLRFDCTAAGTVKDIGVVSHTSFWAPFNVLKGLGAIIKELNK